MGGVFVHWGDIDTPVIVRTVVAVDAIEGANNVNAAAAVGPIPVVVAAMIVLNRVVALNFDSVSTASGNSVSGNQGMAVAVDSIIAAA